MFTSLAAQKDIYCEMSNAEFPLFTAEKPFKTTSVTIEEAAGICSLKVSDSNSTPIYNLKGQLIKTEDGKTLDQVKKTLPSGVYIVNGQKVIIK